MTTQPPMQRLGDPDDKEFMTTLAKGLAVLGAFGQQRPTMTLSEAAQVADLSRATARRALRTLTQLGYVQQESRTFSLSPQILSLGFAYLSIQSWIDRALPLMRELTQLAQLEVSFGDFTRIGVSRVNGLAVGEGRFERVVATLGIFFLGGSGCDGACICATRFAGRTARFTVTGAWFAVFVSGGASFSRRWRSSASSMSAVVLRHGRWRAS